MSLTPPEMQGSVVTRAAHECNGSDKQLEQHPWQCGYPQATTDATFARQYVAFARTEAISPLELPARSAPVPILGTKLEKGLPLKEITHKWKHVPGLEPYSCHHWVRINEDDHVQMEWSDPTGRSDSTALGVLLQKNLYDVNSDLISSLLLLGRSLVDGRLVVICKAAQATCASEEVTPIDIPTDRTHSKIQKKRGPVPSQRTRTRTQRIRTRTRRDRKGPRPAPHIPFGLLPKHDSSSQDDTDDQDESSEEEEPSGQGDSGQGELANSWLADGMEM